MKKRIGILTSGGDCPGLNATIRGVAKACYEKFGEDVQIIGIEEHEAVRTTTTQLHRRLGSLLRNSLSRNFQIRDFS